MPNRRTPMSVDAKTGSVLLNAASLDAFPSTTEFSSQKRPVTSSPRGTNGLSGLPRPVSSSDSLFPDTFTCAGSSEVCNATPCCQDAHVECSGDCPAVTVACSDAHCNEPNWCEELHNDICNDLDCHVPPCEDTTCPESFSHFDTCFQSECAPSTWSTSCPPAPCASGECGGTFVTDTCGDFEHHGWDPNCPNATLRPQDVLHDYTVQPWPGASLSADVGSAYHIHAPVTLGHLHQFVSPPQLHQPSFTTNHGFGLGMSPYLSHNELSDSLAGMSPPRKRKRSSPSIEGSSQTLISTSPSTPPASEFGSVVPESIKTGDEGDVPSICLWVLNPHAPSEQHQKCGFHASDAAELHAHVTRCHTKQLTSKATFVCCWFGCERFMREHFGQKSKLDRHLQTHDGFMPYQCEICGKRFITKDQRRNHQATHLNLQEWKCHVCGKSFNAPTSLKTHMNIHTGRKPHLCWICGHRDGDSSNFSKHMKSKHPGAPKKRPDDFNEMRDHAKIRGYVLEKDRERVEQEREKARAMTKIKIEDTDEELHSVSTKKSRIPKAFGKISITKGEM